MPKPTSQPPIILFAYNRPVHLKRTLDCLRENEIPLLYAFSDGPRTPEARERVNEVREILRAIDWCKVVLVEREQNMGLGRSIVAGVASVLDTHNEAIVFEDDLICVPGTYRWVSAALEHYRDDPRVMSITGWTHPSVIPGDATDQPYFDGRAECLVWATWARAWKGMEIDARTKMEESAARGIDVYEYGADLVQMAETELQRNIWAVRLLYHHILHKALCVRPPYSMVEHIGFDAEATNASDGTQWANPPLRPCPPIPVPWPEPVLNPQCPVLWRKAFGGRPPPPGPLDFPRRVVGRLRGIASKVLGIVRGRG